MSAIELQNITKKWDDFVAVDDVTFTVDDGSFLVLLGPSGCGKSTTLRIIAGLDSVSSGTILIGGKDVTDMLPAKRQISMAFQSYALFPHLNVAENIIFGLKVRKVDAPERDRRLNEVAEIVGLSGLLQRKPTQLLGGQRQRVALARATIAENSICLMDEPLSNLDAKLRHEILCTLAAYAFARFEFRGKDIAFALVLVQLMIMPEVLIVENYATMSKLGLVDTISGIGLHYMASAFGIFLLRQSFKTIPKELDDAARIEGCSMMQILWNVYVPLSRSTYLAYGLVSVSYHWNNFLWPLIITNSVETRPLTVGLGIFGAPESGVDWSIISAATLLAVAPLLVAFLLFQRQFVQSFMHAGIK